MKNRKKLDYFSVAFHACLFVLFMVFNRLEKQPLPYSIAIFDVAMVSGANVFITPLLLLVAFLFSQTPGYLFAGAIASLLFIIISFLYKKSGAVVKWEITAYALLSTVAFIVLGDTKTFLSIEKRILTSFFIVLLSATIKISASAITEKGLKFKWNVEEKACLLINAVLFGLGFSNLISPLVWKSICVLLVLLSAFIYRSDKALVFSVVLGLSNALYYSDLAFLSIYLLYGLSSLCFIQFSRFASVVAIVATDYLAFTFLPFGYDYTLMQFVFMMVGGALFLVIPYKPISNLKEKLYSFREKQLSRTAINRNRTFVSNRLYNLSGVFNEMAQSFTVFNQNSTKEQTAKNKIVNETLNKVCANCSNYSYCKNQNFPDKNTLIKLIDIGFAKGKLSLIDFPHEKFCAHPNNIIFFVNKNLSSYRNKILENDVVDSGRQLIASQALGVAEILKGLALETGALLKYQSRTERALSDALFKNGFYAQELLIYGEEEGTTVSLITPSKEFSLDGLCLTVSKTVGINMTLTDKVEISEDKCFLCFKHSPDYDAVFGVSSAVKDGSNSCGDTYSVVRLNEGKFLIALSDGMGSGDKAQKVSNTSLSLIESFYKAGLDSSLILNTVNKLLAVNTADCFTALDLSVINLQNATADFVKYGSPYAFILGKNGIKIIEGNSLPLGILEDLKPSVCNAELTDGDTVLFLSDGVSDAFGSSSEIIDFLRNVPAFNPQTLADKIMEKALALSNGKKNDDMTVLAVRIFKKASLLTA